jgi:hypothetical protein
LNNLRFGLGIGKEKIGGSHPNSEDLYRLSASYEYHIGDFGLEPTLAVDFIDGEQAYVLGVALVGPFKPSLQVIGLIQTHLSEYFGH